MSDESSDPSIDARLRQVPLPAGLLARLREGTLPNEQLDESLRAVDLPLGLRENLRGIPADLELDRRLRAVACPQPLKGRLKDIVADEALDEQLREVPYPAWLAVSMRAVWQVPRQNRYAQWAQALALMLLVGVSYALGMSAMLYETFLAGTAREVATVASRFPLSGETAPTESELIAFQTTQESGELSDDTAPLQLTQAALAAGEPLPSGIADVALHGENSSLWNRDIFSFFERDLLGQPLRGDDVMPELFVAEASTPRGIDPPLYRGFDREILLLAGFQPTVRLNENAALNRSLPPLWTETESFERARGEILAGALPEPETIHPEDFLATGDYQFTPVAEGELGLRTAMGPALFGQGDSYMLLVGVQAGAAHSQQEKSTHLVVAVETSHSMDWGNRLELTRQALSQLVAQMRPGDRLSLVGFAEEPVVFLESAAASDGQRIQTAIDSLELGDGTRVVAGLQRAVSLATANSLEQDLTQEVVLVTDGLSDLPQDIRQATTQLMSLAAEDGIGWTVLDLGRPGRASDNLQQLAQAAGGSHIRANTAEQIGISLVEIALGGSTLVAEDAELAVEFDPAAVEAYRLIGHVPGAAGFQTAGKAELRGNQTAVALYEVWLRAGAEQRVATATLRWRDSRTGEAAEVSQQISRVQIALSPETSALPLVTAQVLAQAAEILAGSPHLASDDRRQNLASLLSHAQSVNPRLRERDSHQRLLEWLRAANDL